MLFFGRIFFLGGNVSKKELVKMVLSLFLSFFSLSVCLYVSFSFFEEVLDEKEREKKREKGREIASRLRDQVGVIIPRERERAREKK